jgi:uncharacterized protein (DUF3084 family)
MRIYATLDDKTVEELDGLAEEKSTKRTQLIANAVDRFLHQDAPDGLALDQLKEESDRSRSEIELLKVDLETANKEREELKHQIDQSRRIEEQMQADLEKSHSDADKAKIQIEKSQKELEMLRPDLTRLQSQKAEEKARADSLYAELDQLREAMQQSMHDSDKLREVVKAKDAEISFLRAHIHELSQKLVAPALPGSKPWWQFWR